MSILAEKGPAKELRKRINSIEAELKSLRIQNGIGYTAKRLTTGTTLNIKIPRGDSVESDLKVQKFKITEIGEVVLTCRKLLDDGTEENAIDHNVYRPIMTRPGEGFPSNYVSGSSTNPGLQSRTFNVSITSGTTTKTLSVSQEIIPVYAVGDTIYGVTGVDGSFYSDADEDSVWLDINVDARHWAFTQRMIEVCVNNSIQYMMVIGGGTSA